MHGGTAEKGGSRKSFFFGRGHDQIMVLAQNLPDNLQKWRPEQKSSVHIKPLLPQGIEKLVHGFVKLHGRKFIDVNAITGIEPGEDLVRNLGQHPNQGQTSLVGPDDVRGAVQNLFVVIIREHQKNILESPHDLLRLGCCKIGKQLLAGPPGTNDVPGARAQSQIGKGARDKDVFVPEDILPEDGITACCCWQVMIPDEVAHQLATWTGFFKTRGQDQLVTGEGFVPAREDNGIVMNP
jgi:hypothetical protein